MTPCNIPLFSTILLAFASAYLIIGIIAARSVKTVHNYFLANRNLSVMKLTFALIASQLGSGMILGTAYRAYHMGVWSLLYVVGMSVGFIVLAAGLASRMRSLNIETTAQIFQTHYKSEGLKKIASLLSVVSLWGILVAQIIASKAILTGLCIDNPYIFIGCWCLVILYTMLGGLQSVVMVDMAQVSCIIVIFLGALWYTVTQVPDTILSQFENFFSLQSSTFNNDVSFTTIAPALLIPTLFSLIEQDLAQKFFAAKNQMTATMASLNAGAFLLVFSAVPLFFGMLAKMSHLPVNSCSNPLISALALYCPEILFFFAICAIIAAISSTANSLMCAISSNVVQDFLQSSTSLMQVKIVSALIGITALAASYLVTGDIISILEESYRISVVCLFVPTVYAYFTHKTPAAAAWASIILGFSGYSIMRIFPATPLINDTIALSLSFLGYFIVQQIFLRRKTNNPLA